MEKFKCYSMQKNLEYNNKLLGEIMIRKLEKRDINNVMQIWKNDNIKAHQFIPDKYWESN